MGESAFIDKRATGRNIKRLFKASPYTMAEWCDHFHVLNDQSIYKWYNGTTLPKVEHLVLMSKLLDVPVEDIGVCGDRHPERCRD